MRARTADHKPSAAISARPVHAWPEPAATATLSALAATSATANPIDSAMRGSARATCNEGGVQIAPLRDPVGRTVALLDPAPERQARQLGAARPVAHADRLGHADVGAQCARDAQPLEDARAVGADLDAGAFLVEGLAPLQDVRGNPAARERDRRGKAADAAAGDQHRLRAACARPRQCGLGILVGDRGGGASHGTRPGTTTARSRKERGRQVKSSTRLTRQPTGSL